MAQPAPKPPPPSAADIFYRRAFGCFGTLLFRLGVVAIIVFVADWRAKEKYAKREAERAQTSEVVMRIADDFAKETDSDGRFVRRPEGPLEEADVWGHPLRLTYQPGRFSDGLEVRSAGPDGEWQTWDDVIATRSSNISSKALAREAGSGLLDAAKERLWGKKKDAEKKDDEKKGAEK